MTISQRRPHDEVREIDARRACPQELPKVLVDLIELHLLGKQAHWNLIGTNFRDRQL
jgi:DNA-binding ferritin-like protein